MGAGILRCQWVMASRALSSESVLWNSFTLVKSRKSILQVSCYDALNAQPTVELTSRQCSNTETIQACHERGTVNLR